MIRHLFEVFLGKKFRSLLVLLVTVLKRFTCFMYLETAVYEQKVTSVSEGQITDTVLGSYCLLSIQSSSASKLMIAVYHCYSMLSFGCIKPGRRVSNRRSEKKLFKQYKHYNFGHLFPFVCPAYAFSPICQSFLA